MIPTGCSRAGNPSTFIKKVSVLVVKEKKAWMRLPVILHWQLQSGLFLMEKEPIDALSSKSIWLNRVRQMSAGWKPMKTHYVYLCLEEALPLLVCLKSQFVSRVWWKCGLQQGGRKKECPKAGDL